jgi:hypothetical protein
VVLVTSVIPDPLGLWKVTFRETEHKLFLYNINTDTEITGLHTIFNSIYIS